METLGETNKQKENNVTDGSTKKGEGAQVKPYTF